ncbi:MAG: polysaccharide biosynthesis protein [Bacteroidales bacterium]|nr:polysaccharide biosynthesis protein [Bacteroidales bacterium]
MESSKFPSELHSSDWIMAPIVIVVVRFFFFLIFKVHRQVVRYTNTTDVIKIFFSCLSGSLFIVMLNFVITRIKGFYIVPNSVMFMEFFITLVLIIVYRFIIKIYYQESKNPSKGRKNIVILGAGESGLITKRTIERDNASKYNVLAFFDNDPQKIGMQVESLPIIDSSELKSYLSENNISFLIIAVQKISNAQVKAITDTALPFNVKVLKVPPVNKWLNGNLSFKQIKKVKIEDLLERDPIQLDLSLLNPEIVGQTIMITGAAGSIGSEIVRQLLNFDYKQLVLIDEAETPCFFLQNEIRAANQMKDVHLHILDICDRESMELIMQKYHPSVIYHAAAYKHVPMMECNVSSAIKVNVGGTKGLADMAVKYGVKKFVMVSTDKAVNPTNVMGASKRIAEMYVQSLNFHQDTTKFVTTRFGNVLGSNGSVIPIFRNQIENGGPITITHPDITRYFMTIPEACQLVITAGAMGKGGEIYIFDMGKSVRISDLAKKMIQLSGLTLDKDITIKYTGLRPGEKLYEELLATEENTTKTTHKKIMVAKVRTYEYETLVPEIEKLIGMQHESQYDIVAQMKQIVPEYISQNSEFEAIDQQNKHS